MARAMDWVSRILAVTVEMVLPGLLGQWLDKRLGTNVLVLVGFGLGVVLGMTHLLAMVRADAARQESKRKTKGSVKR